MSERIKELMEQTGVPLSMPFDKWCEKFAELIVKETMQVVANQLPSNQYLDVAQAVIEHFGVKE
jgi:uncharacterized FlaG/YvyC family protein